MFQGWRFQLREAEEALRQGQLDESYRLLMQANGRHYLPGRRLSARVAAELARRASRRAAQVDFPAAWRDLARAVELAGENDSVVSARQDVVAMTIRELERFLENGDPSRAIQLIEDVERHQVREEPLRSIKDMAHRLDSARKLARRGEFADAATQALAVGNSCSRYGFAVEKAQAYEASIEPFRGQTEALRRAVATGQWTEAASLADQTLAMAPENQLALEVRRRAWSEVGAALANPHRRRTAGPGRYEAAAAAIERPAASSVALAEREAGRRFLLWVDGVGGFLVCLANEVTMGQATSENAVAVPIQADLSREHARIHRRGSDYVIEPLHATWVNGQRIRGKTLVSDGDEIKLAGHVRLRFRQPHALSASARLDFASHHRTMPRADGILLMAESCVLGPKRQNHVVCSDWQNDVVLYRRDGELYCRAMESVEVDGQSCHGRARLGPNSHVSGSDFSLSFEGLS